MEKSRPDTVPPLMLVVDDDREARTTARQAFEQAGFRVCEASDGREGCERFDTVRPDFVLLDLGMPKMDGFDACAAIRRHV